MANLQLDPLQTITQVLRDIFEPDTVKNVMLGWPDTKFFEVDGNLPSLIVFSVGETGKNLVSRETVHAVVNDTDGLTATVYKEQLRITYQLQLSLFANTVEDRSNLGWQIQQYLVTHPQMQIGSLGVDVKGNPVETALWKFQGQAPDDPGETNFYHRAMTFEVSARVLDAQTAVPIATTVTLNNNT